MIGGLLEKLFGRRTQHGDEVDRFARQPWLYQKHATKSQREQQLRYQSELRALGECSFGQNVYVSPGATIDTRRVLIGDNSAVGAEAQIGFDVEIGRDCTVNAGAIIRGLVRIGDNVRIASGAQVLGFNHGWDDLEKPIWLQPISREGITIGDDVWIGANAVILDGISIGSHAVIGAGAIVTRNVPSWTIAVGNPARVVRSRKYGSLSSADGSLRRKWDQFATAVVVEMQEVLSRSWQDSNFVNMPDDPPKMRAWTDAVELASMTGCPLPGPSGADLIATLRSFQDPSTGLAPGPYLEAKFDPVSSEAAKLETTNAAYMAMALGYALECLGSTLGHPVKVAHNLTAEQLTAKLDSLPWSKNAWQAGAWIDHFASACFFNQRHHALVRNMDDLREWLISNVDPRSGMWGKPRSPGDWLQPVNGFYRLTRGAHAQFGWDLDHSNGVIDTVLAHAHDARYFGPQRSTACYVLDIVHPLLMAHLARGVDHIIATDNASVDGTSEILEEFERAGCLSLLREPSDDYLQEEWVNRMIEIVRDRYPDAWIINNDADEFWRPPDREDGGPGDLKVELKNVNAPSALCRRHNMITSVENLGKGHWCETLVWRAREPVNWPKNVNIKEHALDHPYFLYNLPNKVAVNTKGLIRVHKGSHTVSHHQGGPPHPSAIQIFHYPIRSRIEFEKSVGRIADALRRNPPPGNTSAKYIRWGSMLVRHGTIEPVLRDALPTRGQILKMRLKGMVQRDTKLRMDFLRKS